MASSLAWLSDEAREELERERDAAAGAAPSAPRAPTPTEIQATPAMLRDTEPEPDVPYMGAPTEPAEPAPEAPPPAEQEPPAVHWLDPYREQLDAEQEAQAPPDDWLAPYREELEATQPQVEYFDVPRRRSAPSGGGGRGRPSKDDVFAYLLDRGVPPNHAAGMIANIQGESNFDPSAIGDNGTSGGLFQHHADRFNRMVSHAGPNWKSNWQGQIDYALSEPDTQAYLSRDFRSPEDASYWFTTQWERPANADQRARERLAFLPGALPDYSIIDQPSSLIPDQGEEVS